MDVIAPLATELRAAIDSIYGGPFHTQFKTPSKPSDNTIQAMVTIKGHSAPQVSIEDWWIILRPSPISFADVGKLGRCDFSVAVTNNLPVGFAIDDTVSVNMHFAQCQITTRGIHIEDEIFNLEDPAMFRRALRAFHDQAIVSILTQGAEIIRLVCQIDKIEEFVHVLDRRYLRYCVEHGIDYLDAAEVDLGRWQIDRTYRRELYADDDTLRWPGHETWRDHESRQQTSPPVEQPPNSSSTTGVSCHGWLL